MKLSLGHSMLVILFLAVTAAHAEQGKLRMHVINVGQAESILIEMPQHALLIDAGGEATKRDTAAGEFYRRQLTEYLDKFFTDNPHLNRTLYAVILSHPHSDHTKYLTFIMNRYTVQNFIEGGHGNSPFYSGMRDVRDVRRIVVEKNLGHIRVKHTTLDSSKLASWASDIQQRSGARVRFLSGRRGCNDANNDSLVMRIEYGQKSLLLTGDSEVDDLPFNNPNNVGCGGQLPYLLRRYENNLSVLDADVYKVGHHAARNGTYKKFLEAVTPEYAIISAGHFKDRSPGEFHGWNHGHPNESTVKLLERFVTASRSQPVTVYTMREPKRVKQNRTVEKGIYCTCWGARAVVVTLSDTNAPISVIEIPQ